MDVKRQLLLLSDAVHFVSPEGIPGIEMQAKFNDGEFRFAVPVRDLGKVLHFFLNMNQFLSDEGLLPDKTHDLIGPVPIHGVSFHQTESSPHTLLVVALSGCKLAFSLPNSDLARLGADIGRIATTLSADSTRPN